MESSRKINYFVDISDEFRIGSDECCMIRRHYRRSISRDSTSFYFIFRSQTIAEKIWDLRRQMTVVTTPFSMSTIVWSYHTVRKVRATTLLLQAWNIWFPPLCRASIFRMVYHFRPNCFIAFLGKERSFHDRVCSCFRYDGGDGDLVPLYLVTQKSPEDENCRV